jgi:hypothetical protein
MDEKIALLKTLGFTDEFLAFLKEGPKYDSYEIITNDIGPLSNESMDTNDIIFQGLTPNAVTDKIGNNIIY